MHTLSSSADWQWTHSPKHWLFRALKTILGTWRIHVQACLPLKLWAQQKEWYVLSHSSKNVSETLLILMHWDYFSFQQRSIKHKIFFGQDIAKENSHCYVRVRIVQVVHKHVPWGYLLSVITVGHSEVAANIFVSTF